MPRGADPEARWCSVRCRRLKLSRIDGDLESELRRRLDRLARGSTLCPSEIARAVVDDEGWRALMEPARQAARRLVAEGVAEITQSGRVVDPSTAKGPIRIRPAGLGGAGGPRPSMRDPIEE